MNKPKKDTPIYIILVIIIILIILGIFWIKNPNKKPTDEEVMKCIAEKSIIYSSTTCGACRYQEQILGDYYSLFQEINCFKEIQKCIDAHIEATPTWIINGEKYTGVKSIQKLKELTEC